MKILSILTPFLLLVLLSQTVQAQERLDTVRMWRIETIDDNKFVGIILERDTEKVRLRTQEFGELSIPIQRIRSMEVIDPESMVNGEVWEEHTQTARYFWVPNGYGLKKGEGYYQNVWVLFNQVSYGFTDYFSMGLGVVPAFLFAGASTPIWITPKFSIPVVEDKFNLGIGVLAATIVGEESGIAGLTYGVGTFGSRDHNLSVGIGYGYADGYWADIPTFNLSGTTRIGKRTYLMTENYVITGDGETAALVFLGGRTVWDRLSLDYGLLIPASSGIDSFVGIPWLGIVLPFGK